ncbi:hypothetical protein PFISCL1PPCAC_18763, partial [Pristionchus fissidentatus]
LRVVVLSTVFLQNYALVQFTNSRLYDEYDLAVPTLELPQYCSLGCRIFASVPEGSAEIAKNIKVHDYMNNDDSSLFDISRQVRNGDQKGFYEVAEGNDQLNFVNTNPGNVAAPMAVWVVTGAAGRFTATVFDAASLDMTVPRSLGYVTVMGATPFTLTSTTTGEMMMLAKLTGYDAVDGDVDDCTTALEQMNADSYADFRLGVSSPLISFFYDNLPTQDGGFPDTVIALKATPGLDATNDFSGPSFVASPGYVGCTEGKTFRSSLYAATSTYKFSTSNKFYDVSLTAELNTDAAHPVTINDVANGQVKTLSGNKAGGTNNQPVLLEQTDNLEISWTRNELDLDKAFLIQVIASNEQTHTTTPAVEDTTTAIEEIAAMTTTQPDDATSTTLAADDHTDAPPDPAGAATKTSRRTTLTTTGPTTSVHPKDVTTTTRTTTTTTTTVTPTTSGAGYG